ncbi:MAG: zinc ribbon domain-containing protein [Balneolaceae bacterium]|nr:MAG: zinc ribbon domain-containing protein [Balneolaceae bacterium]
MPTYEYSREDGTVFDYFQGINDAALDVCPTTGQKVKRIISGGSGVIYKGDGWYVTDYKNKNKNGSSSKGDVDGSGSGNGNGKSSSDTKESSSKAEPAASTTSGSQSGSDS